MRNSKIPDTPLNKPYHKLKVDSITIFDKI